MPLTPRDLQRLQGCHPDLIKVAQTASDLFARSANPSQSFFITEGMRTAEEEYNLWISCHNLDGTRNGQPWKTNCNGYPVGTTTPSGIPGTGESRHQHGHAFDYAILLNGVYVQGPLTVYQQAADACLQAGAHLNIPVVYGGSWLAPKTDSDHIELSEASYPQAVTA